MSAKNVPMENMAFPMMVLLIFRFSEPIKKIILLKAVFFNN